LSAYRLDCHVQFFSSFCNATLFGDNPKIVKVLVIEVDTHVRFFTTLGIEFSAFFETTAQFASASLKRTTSSPN
jgi:hypothetical protein